MRIPKAKVKVEYVSLRGGLNTESIASLMPAGEFIQGNNYLCSANGGYDRIGGYERFSGQPAPSDAVYYRCPCTYINPLLNVGDTITGVLGMARVITVGSNYINTTQLVGSFGLTEIFMVNGLPMGEFAEAWQIYGESSQKQDAIELSKAADTYRNLIAKPAGGRPIRGLGLLNGVVYAFVDNSAGTTGEIYKSTSSGWEQVPLQHEIRFSHGTAAPSEGQTITQDITGATAIVSRTVHQSGTWAGGTAAGRLIIRSITGTFGATQPLRVGGTHIMNAASLATAITIQPQGRYEVIVNNFTGSTSTTRIYGCDGKNRGFEFDGTVYVPIETGMADDKPQHVACFKKHLVFSYKSSSQFSVPGQPYMWSAVLGAAEMAVGHEVTGYSIEAETLLIHSRNATHRLSGDNIGNFILNPLSSDIGAIPYTRQNIGAAYCLDDRGIIQVTRAQEFGNFNLGSVSRRIQTEIDRITPLVTASSVHPSLNQYRIYASDGTGICMTMGQGDSGLAAYFACFSYPVSVSCTVSGEGIDGKDVVYFGTSDGWVCRADVGSSFDGADIEAIIFMAFNNSGTPTVLKSYRKAFLETQSRNWAELMIRAELSYGDIDKATQDATYANITGEGGLWDVSTWGRFHYDTPYKTILPIHIMGDGINISLSVYTKSRHNRGHKLEGIILHYTPRRLER